MIRRVLLCAAAGAAIATLPGRAGVFAAIAGALSGALAGAASREERQPFSPVTLLLAALFVPALTMAVPPGEDMAMHVALARGLFMHVLSPAWPGVAVAVYPRGLSAICALFSPLGFGRAGLIAAGCSYLAWWAGLAAILRALKLPRADAIAVLAVFLARTPQAFFGWGGNPTALALGLGLFGATLPAPLALLCFAGACATHPMGALASFIPAVLLALRDRAFFRLAACALGLAAVLLALRCLGPALSPRELAFLSDYARAHENLPLRSLGAVVGDPAAIATALAALALCVQRRFRPVLLAALGVALLALLFAVLPRFDLYPIRFAPLLVLCAAPLWSLSAPRWALAAAFALAIPGHLRWYQRSVPLATRADVEAIARLPDAPAIDGAYASPAQWIPALRGIPITHPHEHVSLFDEIDAGLARLPPARARFP